MREMKIQNGILRAISRLRPAKAIDLPCAVVPRLVGVRAWTPTVGRIITGKMKILSHVLPMNLSAADEFLRVNVVNIPVCVAGKDQKLPVLFGAKHDLKPYEDSLQVMSGGKFWEFPVYWPVMSQEFEIPWERGMHQVPSQGLIELASGFNAHIKVQNVQSGESVELMKPQFMRTATGIKANIAEELLGLYCLYLPFGAKVSVRTKGPDAEIAMQAVTKFFKGFTETDWYRKEV